MPAFNGSTHNICRVLEGRHRWHKAVQDSAKKYQVPVHLQLAIIAQESSFQADARPPRDTFWGIPLGRPTSAYGYPQAIDATWNDYKHDTGNTNANRNNFADAVDFVGWYVTRSSRLCGIAKNDSYHQYLAYHEGQGGFNKKSYLAKNWLIKIAKKLRDNANRYEKQLKKCPFVPESSFWDGFF